MKRTTIFLEESLERDLRALARREGRPVAVLVRAALAAYVQARQRRGRTEPSFVAIGRSGQGDTAERHEELLWQTLTPHESTDEPRPGKALAISKRRTRRTRRR